MKNEDERKRDRYKWAKEWEKLNRIKNTRKWNVTYS